MITPEQAQKAQEFLKTSGYKAPAGAPAAGGTSNAGWYDAVQAQATPPPAGDGFLTKFAKNTVDAAKSGIQEGAEGIDEATTALQDKAAGHDNSLNSELHTGYDIAMGGVKTGAATIGTIFSPVAGLFKTLADKTKESGNKDIVDVLHDPASHPEAHQLIPKLQELAAQHPEIAKGLKNLFAVLSIEAGGEGGKIAKDGVEKVVEQAPNVVKGAVETVNEGVAKTGQAATDLTRNARVGLSKSNLAPEVEASAQRLKDPLSTYDEFYGNQSNALKDVKADNAMNVVGGRIGDAFDKVVTIRKQAGETMGKELEKVGHVKTDVKNALSAYRSELDKQGLSWDPIEKKWESKLRQSPLTSDDRALLTKYADDLSGLGKNPTIAELDAFMKRVPQELDVAKAAKGLTSTTNGERVIKNNLRKLRDSLSGDKNPALKTYADARKQYSELSDFLEEGEKYLGKKTQAGDYAKDASLSKSAVQSLLNNGKKDWLGKLEDLTQYPALDESVLALQAMKDSGDFRGNSLLELLAKDAEGGHIPVTPSGIASKIIGWIASKGGKAIKGTPQEQTRRVLQELKAAKK